MNKTGYVIARSKNVKEYFTAASSFDKPTWTSLEEATVYYSPERAEAAALKLQNYGFYGAKVLPLTEEMEVTFGKQAGCEDEERAAVPPIFTAGQHVMWKGKSYKVVVPDGKADFVGIEVDGKVKMVPQGELQSSTSSENEERAFSRARFFTGQKVNYQDETYNVVQDSGTGNVIIIKDAPNAQPLNVKTAALTLVSEQMQGRERHSELVWRGEAKDKRPKLPLGAKIIQAKDGTKYIEFANGKFMKYDDFVKQHPVKENFTMPKPGDNPAQPDEKVNIIPNLTEPKVDEIQFKDPVGTEEKPETDLDYSGAYPHGNNVKVPQEIKNELKNAIEVFKRCADFNNTRDDTKASFCMTVHAAMTELYDYLEIGTVEAIKMAQIKLSSFMNPITSNIPEKVRDFIYRGGRKPSLKDLFDFKRSEKN
jgi:hypothetical protein